MANPLLKKGKSNYVLWELYHLVFKNALNYDYIDWWPECSAETDIWSIHSFLL